MAVRTAKRVGLIRLRKSVRKVIGCGPEFSIHVSESRCGVNHVGGVSVFSAFVG